MPLRVSSNSDIALSIHVKRDIAQKFVGWKQGIRIAEEVYRTQLLQFDSQVS
jgi:hypothetical protein